MNSYRREIIQGRKRLDILIFVENAMKRTILNPFLLVVDGRGGIFSHSMLNLEVNIKSNHKYVRTY